MSYRFEYEETKRIKNRIAQVLANMHYSVEDQCLVTATHCSVCGRFYDEELVYARAMAVVGLPFVCILCDQKSIEPFPPEGVIDAALNSFWRSILGGG